MTGDVGVAGQPAGATSSAGADSPRPGLQNFDFKPLFTVGSFHFTKPMLHRGALARSW